MKKNIVAIVQARMGSTRLPGKVLMDISGKPMLWHVINRLKKCRHLDKITIATSTNRDDDIIEEFCRRYEICFFRGSETNVLDRYYQAAKDCKADIVIRITSDCPLIDPEIVDQAVSMLLKNKDKLDIVSNTIKRTYPRGLDVEVFPFSVLETCNKKATEAHQKEHVTVYIYENAGASKSFSLENKMNLSHLRWTVDEIADLKFVREIYKRLFNTEDIFLTKDVLKILEKEPGLIGINENTKQKSIK